MRSKESEKSKGVKAKEVFDNRLNPKGAGIREFGGPRLSWTGVLAHGRESEVGRRDKED